MKKTFYPAFLVTLLAGLALEGTTCFSIVQASTEVAGIITTDTIWTQAHSPYYLAGNVLVDKGVTLTIESGVTVNFTDSDYYIRVDGTLIARGTNENPIYFNYGRSIRFTEDSNGWKEETDEGSIIENAILTRVDLEVYGSPKVNNNTFVRSGIGIQRGNASIVNNFIDGTISVLADSPEIVNNTILGKAISDSLGRPVYKDYGIYIDTMNGDVSALIANNVVSGDFTQASIKIDGGTPIIERNLVSNSYGYGSDSDRHQSGILIDKHAEPIIQNNTITKNARGITCGSSLVTISYNNLHDNSGYNLYLSSGSTGELNATNNWWGTTNTTLISQSIYDFEEDFDLGTVTFVPFLTEPNPEEMSTSIPEFPPWTILPLLLTATVLVIFCRRKLKTIQE
ncbi:MAG: right-handed parallel beta-helix repeat-containing protein [Candidatus Bathyarchaeota archaeon]|jgi:hypothetical protein